MTSLTETFAQVRIGLEQSGMVKPDISLFQRDQMCAAFRADLVSLGLDVGREGSIESALAGMAIGMKTLIQSDMPVPFINHYVFICECLLPMLEESTSDLSSLGDSDFLASLNRLDPRLGNYAGETEPEPPVLRFACSKCGASDAVVPVGAFHFCIPCASEAVTGGLAALRLAGSGIPKMGGPEFERTEESAHDGVSDPQPSLGTGHAEAAADAGVETAEATVGGTVDTPPPPSWKELLRQMRDKWKEQK
jgi:hypothetical protein